MKIKYMLIVIGITILTCGTQNALAQESLRLRALPVNNMNFRSVAEPVEVKVDVLEETPVFEVAPVIIQPAVVIPTVTSQPAVVVTPSSAEIGQVTCKKTVSGTCTLFSCSDGTKTNTCDITCKTTKTADPSLTGAVATDEPKITNFFPESGNAGTHVRVYLTKGQKAFSAPDSFEIGGVKAKITLYSNVVGSKADFYADLIVPEGAKTGKITVTKPQTFAKPGSSDNDFLVIPTQEAPFITSIKPIAGYPGQEVVVEYYMGTKTFSGLDSIELGGVPVVTKTHSDVWSKKPNGYMDKFIIPEGAKTGKITLNKKNFGSVSSVQDFTVIPGTDAPTIISFSPQSGLVGSEVIIKVVAGKKSFSAPDAIYIGELKAEILNGLTDTSGIRTYTIKVPNDAKTGKIILRKPSAFVDVATDKNFQVQVAGKGFLYKITNLFKGN